MKALEVSSALRMLASGAILLSFVCHVLGQGAPNENPTIVSTCDEASLRAAVDHGGIIRFQCDGTIVLTNALNIRTNCMLDGTSHVITLSGGGKSRLFNVEKNVSLRLVELSLAQGTDDGNVPGHPADGKGGAILNLGGKVMIESCKFVGNSVTGYHGQFAVQGGDAMGGDIHSENGQVAIMNSMLQSSSATGGDFNTFPVPRFTPVFTETRGGSISMINGSLFITNSKFSRQTIHGANALADGSFGGPAFGGVIYASNSVVTIQNSDFSEYYSRRGRHTAYDPDGDMQGGCLYLAGGVATLTECSFRTNTTLVPPLLVTMDVFANGGLFNGVARLGGAIYNAGELVAIDCNFMQNLVLGDFGKNQLPRSPRVWGAGGAIFNASKATILNCTFSENSAIGGYSFANDQSPQPGGEGRGGAIYNAGAIHITNSTFFGNLARGGAGNELSSRDPLVGGDAKGGAIYSTGEAEIYFCTFANNRVIPGLGGTIRNVKAPDGQAIAAALFSEPGVPVSLRASILNKNTGSSNFFGACVDKGWNLSSDASPLFAHAQSRNSIDTLLGTFGEHGGPTFTLVPSPGSAAIDRGPALDLPATDQRGVPRQRGVNSDVGAIESLQGRFAAVRADRSNPGSIQILFDRQDGGNYWLEASTNLTTWSVQAALLNIVRLPSSTPMKFFRVRVE